MSFGYRGTEGSVKVGQMDRKVGASAGRKRRTRRLKDAYNNPVGHPVGLTF
jgi:hypothetical protein